VITKIPLWLFVLAGMAFTFFANYTVIDKIIVPDPCYYHTHDTTKLFNLFYTTYSGDNGHPFPTVFNYIFTLAVGGVASYLLGKQSLRVKA
jgi:hypothetical protein